MPKRPRDEKGYKLSRNFPASRIAVMRPEGNKLIDLTKKINALFDSLVIGNAKSFNGLTEREANYKDACGQSLLARAIELGDLEIVQVLISRGANVNWLDENGNSLLHIAIEEGDRFIINELIRGGVETGPINKDGVSALELAVIIGDPDVIKSLFEHAVLSFNSDMVSFLLELENNNIDINHRSFLIANTLPFMLTPIQFVFYSLDHAHNSNDIEKENIIIKVLKILVSHGADVSLINDREWIRKITKLEDFLDDNLNGFYATSRITEEEFPGIRNWDKSKFKELFGSPNYINFFSKDSRKILYDYNPHTTSEIILYYKIFIYSKAILKGTLSLDEDFDFFTFENEELFLKIEDTINSYIYTGDKFTWEKLRCYNRGNFLKDISQKFGVEYLVNIIFAEMDLQLMRRTIVHIFSNHFKFSEKDDFYYYSEKLITPISKILQLMKIDDLNKIGILGIIFMYKMDIKNKIILSKPLIERGVDIDENNLMKMEIVRPAILMASENSDSNMLKFLIEQGANINVLYKGKNILEIVIQKYCGMRQKNFDLSMKKHSPVFKIMILNGLKLHHYGCDEKTAKTDPGIRYSYWKKINYQYNKLSLDVNSQMDGFYNSVAKMKKSLELSDYVNDIFVPFIGQLEETLYYGKRKLPGLHFALSKYFSIEEMSDFSSKFPLINKAAYKFTGGKLNSEAFIELGLKPVDVLGDGNCFFHAVARQLELLNNGDQAITFEELREFAVNYIKNHQDRFQSFIIDESIEEYLERISQDGQWADHPLIEALAQELGINIVIINNAHIDLPHVVGGGSSQNSIYLGHLEERHYVSLEQTNVGISQALQAQVQMTLDQRVQEVMQGDQFEEEQGEDCETDNIRDNSTKDKELNDSDDYLDYFLKEDEIPLENIDHSSYITSAVGLVLLGAHVMSPHHD